MILLILACRVIIAMPEEVLNREERREPSGALPLLKLATDHHPFKWRRRWILCRYTTRGTLARQTGLYRQKCEQIRVGTTSSISKETIGSHVRMWQWKTPIHENSVREERRKHRKWERDTEGEYTSTLNKGPLPSLGSRVSRISRDREKTGVTKCTPPAHTERRLEVPCKRVWSVRSKVFRKGQELRGSIWERGRGRGGEAVGSGARKEREGRVAAGPLAPSATCPFLPGPESRCGPSVGSSGVHTSCWSEVPARSSIDNQ